MSVIIDENNNEFYSNLYKSVAERFKFPNDKKALYAWEVYKPSVQTELFLSEEGRSIYAEAFDFTEDPTIIKSQELQKVKKKPKSVDESILFGEQLDTELPLEEVIGINNDVYWRRVVEKKLNKNKLLLIMHQNYANFKWKNWGISLKLSEILENTEPEQFDLEKLLPLATRCKKYLFDLEVNQQMSMNELLLEKNIYNPMYRIFNYPPNGCHHGKLGSILGVLTNLTSLTLQYGQQRVECKYSLRIFELSIEDCINLASGLLKLINLKIFKMKHSRLNVAKCKQIILGLQNCPLESIQLSYCELSDKCGKYLGLLLQQNEDGTLKEIELLGNKLGGFAMEQIAIGLRYFTGRLEYLGISKNPIGTAGIVGIGSGFNNINQILSLNLAGCQIKQDLGKLHVVQILGFHMQMEAFNCSNIRLGEKIGDKLIENVKKHFNLLYLECRQCDFTENQELQLSILIERNNYYNKNPILFKNYFSISDANEIDKWIKKIKHPILCKVIEKTKSFNTNRQTKLNSFTGSIQYPKFITKDQQIIASNAEILGCSYIDCNSEPIVIRNSTDSTNKISSNENVMKVSKFNANELCKKSYLRSVEYGTFAPLNIDYYF